jgi:hypothetical protein
MNSYFFNANKEGNYTLSDVGVNSLVFVTADGKYVTAQDIAKGIGAESVKDLTMSYNGRARGGSMQGDINTMKIVDGKTGKSIDVNMYAMQNQIDYNDGFDAKRNETYFNNEFSKWAMSKRDKWAIPVDKKNHMEYMLTNGFVLPDDATMNANIARYSSSVGMIERSNGKVDYVWYNPNDPNEGSVVIKTYPNRKAIESMAKSETLGSDIIAATEDYIIEHSKK